MPEGRGASGTRPTGRPPRPSCKRLQSEWRTIGAVKKSRSDAVWQRFRAACDHFFDRYKNRDAHAREAAQSTRGSGSAPSSRRSSPRRAPRRSRPPTSSTACRPPRPPGARRAGCRTTRWPRSTSASSACATGWSSFRPGLRGHRARPRGEPAQGREAGGAGRGPAREPRPRPERGEPDRRRTSPRACATRSPPTRSGAARRGRSEVARRGHRAGADRLEAPRSLPGEEGRDLAARFGGREALLRGAAPAEREDGAPAGQRPAGRGPRPRFDRAARR